MTIMPQDFIGEDDLSDFIAAGHDKLRRMEACIAKTTPQGLAELNRELHSLKGNAQAFGFESLAQLCHRFEDALSDEAVLSNQVRHQIAIYLSHLDVALGQLSPT
ncbi:MAG: Hpt domain-containing protein [Pseudomonadota bacterium]